MRGCDIFIHSLAQRSSGVIINMSTYLLKLDMERRMEVMLFSFLSFLPMVMLADNPFAAMITPIVQLLNQVLTPAILLVAALGSIYCVLLGVKLAKAEEPQEHQKAKMALKNAIIGFVLIFVLVVALKVGIGPLSDWMNSQTWSLEDMNQSGN